MKREREPAPVFLDTNEVSERYKGKIKPRTLISWRSEGRGPPYHKIGGAVLYREDEVEAWEKHNKMLSTFQKAERTGGS